jgi:hypothetical protein
MDKFPCGWQANMTTTLQNWGKKKTQKKKKKKTLIVPN